MQEMIAHALYALFFFIAGIVAAVAAGNRYSGSGAAGAAAVSNPHTGGFKSSQIYHTTNNVKNLITSLQKLYRAQPGLGRRPGRLRP